MNSSTPNPAEGRPHLQVADPARLRAAAEDDAWNRFAQAEIRTGVTRLGFPWKDRAALP